MSTYNEAATVYFTHIMSFNFIEPLGGYWKKLRVMKSEKKKKKILELEIPQFELIALILIIERYYILLRLGFFIYKIRKL